MVEAIALVLSGVAIVASVLTAVYTLGRSTRYQLDHRDFERDRDAGIRYIQRAEALDLRAFASPDAAVRRQADNELYDMQADWRRSASNTERVTWYFTDKNLPLMRTRNAAERGEPTEPEFVRAYSEFDKTKDLVRYWAYPERRREVLTNVLRDRLTSVGATQLPLKLQIDRWLLHDLPSPSRLAQIGRRISLSIRLQAYYLFSGKVPERLREWRIGQQETNLVRARMRAEKRAARPTR